MAQRYKEQQAISHIEHFFNRSDDKLYKEHFIKRIGQTTDTQRCYADLYAEYINKLLPLEIPQRERKNYKVKTHQDIEKIEIKDTSERERNIATKSGFICISAVAEKEIRTVRGPELTFASSPSSTACCGATGMKGKPLFDCFSQLVRTA